MSNTYDMKQCFKNRNAKLLEKIGFNRFYSSFLNELICSVGYRDWQGIDEYTVLTSNIPNFQCQQKLKKNGYLLASSVAVLSLLCGWPKFLLV